MGTAKEKHGVDFDTELTHGPATYDRVVGRWWLDQSADGPHRAAYRNIVKWIAEFLPAPPRVVVDYACGPGHLVARLLRAFREARVVGIDGSALMAETARARGAALGARAAARLETIHSPLPNFKLPPGQADLVLFAFPNICPGADEQPYYDRHGGRNRADTAVARRLANAREPNPEDETNRLAPEDLYTALMDCKVISRNIRGLLRRGGICARIEYANARRDQMTRLTNLRLDFEAGAMGEPFEGRAPERIFRRLQTTYYRSRVIDDVYSQTGDATDAAGGYLITFLKAL